MKSLKIIVSGGGTGGHIFPAVAIAQEIQNRFPEASILFIGAYGKMEMEKVPQAGFKIEALPMAGFQRGSIKENLNLPFKVIKSLLKVRKILKDFQPDFVVGTGGFVSAPSLWMAQNLGIPTFVQEQNALPGKTNRFLAKKAQAVFTAFPDMDHFFGTTPTYFFGNPIRGEISQSLWEKSSAKKQLGLDENQLCVLSVGGSLGSRNINNAWKKNIGVLEQNNAQLLWQTGRLDYQAIQKLEWDKSKVFVNEFIKDMSLAYAAADVVVSRAGAISISELAVAQKPVVLVPYPFAAEDHQTLNATSLVHKQAALMIKDSELDSEFLPLMNALLSDENKRNDLKSNIRFFAKKNATPDIVTQIFKQLNNPTR